MRIRLAGVVAAALFSAGPLAAQDAADLFGKLDTNKDGYVTPDEVQESQKALYERMLRNADKDGDKKLSKDEFLAGLKPDETPKPPLAGGQPFGPPGGKAKGDPRQFFDRLDANKDGKLSKDELPEQLRERFSQMDGNGDGFVTPEEFGRGAAQAFGKRPPGAPPAPGGDAARRAAEGFDSADANKDGKLTKDELPEGFRAGFEQMLQRLNVTGDSITKEQYVRGMVMAAQATGAAPQGNTAAAQRATFESLFDRTDSNSDGKLTKDEIPEERPGMRAVLERSGGSSIDKEQFVRGMIAMMAQSGGQPPRPDGAPQPEGAPRPGGAQRPDGPPRRPDGAPGNPPPGGGLFAALDTDRNGELSTTEIVAAGSTLLKLDRNGDGKLTPEEVFGGPPPGAPGRPGEGRPSAGQPGNPPGAPNPERRPGQRGLGGLNPEEFRERLKQADTNGDGKISKDEAPPLIKERFDRIDQNNDGFVDESEIREMLRRMADGGGKAKARPNDDNK